MTDKNTDSVQEAQPISESLSQFTAGLIQDLDDLRSGKIGLREARVRAQMAREVLRSVHLQLEGMRVLATQAKQINGPAE